jgi:putative transcriptional regulator
MGDTTSLRNHLLIAMPTLHDPNFFHTVTYICEHNDDGAMGIVINRPLDVSLAEVLAHMEIAMEESAAAAVPVLGGGPVQRERGFVLHRPVGDWTVSLTVTDEIAVTTSRDILEAMARSQGPSDVLVALGYAGWGAGQLEQEISDNAWLNGPANPAILFQTPFEQRWHAAAALIGVDLNTLSAEVGHA